MSASYKEYLFFPCRYVPFSGTGFLVPPQVFSSAAEAPEKAPGSRDVAASEGAGDVDEMVGAKSGGVPGVEGEEKKEDSDHTSERAGVEDGGGKSRNDGKKTLEGGDRVSRIGVRRFDHS